MTAMIFAAGLGTRLRPLTDTMPKALVPLIGKPLLQWQVEKLREAGINDIIVNVHHFPDQIINAIQTNHGWGTHITISDERDQLLETGGGLYHALSRFTDSPIHQFTNSPLLICNVDILSNIDLTPLLRLSVQHPNTSYLVVSSRPTQRYLCFDDHEQLCGWTNIQTGELKGQDGHHLAYSGLAIISPTLFPILEQVYQSKGPKFSIIDVFLASLTDSPIHRFTDSPIKAYTPTNYRMMDVGKIEQITEAEAFAKSLQE